jgi:hypothetical protein
MTGRARRLSVILVFGATAASCGGGPAAPVVDEQFVAFGHDFAGFDTWPSQALAVPSLTGSPHAAGARTVFINRLPPAGATAFPVGTIIVKRTEADGQLLARVKRGGSYNATGTVGWEWFELLRAASGAVSIKWRGFGPPSGEAYGGDPKEGCNPCHLLAASNDYVLTPGLVPSGAGDAGVVSPDGGADQSPDAEFDAGVDANEEGAAAD